MKTLYQFLEQGEPTQADPKVKQAEKKENMLKKRVLSAKMRAVRGGATGIMASHEPEGEVIEGAMTMIGKKKPEKKAAKAMDAGARAKRKLARKVHAYYVSGSEDNVPDDIREGIIDAVKKGAKRHSKAVEKKKIKNRKAVPYAALAAQHEPEGDMIDEACWKGYKAYGMKKKGNRMVPNCKPIGSVKKEETQVDEAKVDQGRSDYGKASIRNYRRKGPGHGEPAMFDPENKRGKLIDKRREEHKARRGVKGAKVPAYKVDEALVEPKDGVDSAKEVRKATRKAAFRPFNKESVVDEGVYERRKTKEVIAALKRDKRNLPYTTKASIARRIVSNKGDTSKSDDRYAYESVVKEGKKKGLWDNIHAKRKRGEKPAKPGDKDYPKTLNVEGIKQARKNVGADKCWDGYKAKGTKKKGGKEVPNCVKEEDKAFNYVVAKLKKQHGDGVLTKRDKIKPQSAADKAKARAHQAKVDAENAAERAKDPSQGRYPKG